MSYLLLETGDKITIEDDSGYVMLEDELKRLSEMMKATAEYASPKRNAEYASPKRTAEVH